MVLILIVAALGGGAWYLGPRFEFEPPQVTFKPDAEAVGTAPLRKTLSVALTNWLTRLTRS